MADGGKGTSANTPSGQTPPAAKDAAAKTPKGNPAFRMMGLPNFRFRLPSRNWLIFLSITGSWTAAVFYDRRQKKLVQKKWCDLVSHIADETIPVNSMPRKVTIYLTAPPGDSVRTTRDHFRDYIKPVLVAAALDWDVVEGRREGDVRAGLAERVRKMRKRRGEATNEPLEADTEAVVQDIRSNVGIMDWEGVQGDIVIGRNTWKEYVRGLHEGWLGPLDPPSDPVTDPSSSPTHIHDTLPGEQPTQPAPDTSAPGQDPPKDYSTHSSSVPSSDAPTSPPPTEEPKPTKPRVPPPYIPASATAYASASLPPSLPPELGPSITIPFPHILGFRSTPLRMYRFLNRRHLADDVGRQTAAAVLATYRPFERGLSAQSPMANADGSAQAASPVSDDAPLDTATDGGHWEQETLLQHEEKEWIKSIRERKAGDEGDKVWTDKMILDPRISERMRKFELASEEKMRAERIWQGKEGRRQHDKDGSGEVD